MNMKRAMAAIAIAAATLTGVQAAAGEPPAGDWKICLDDRSALESPTPELQIASCRRVIREGSADARMLANAHRYLGYAQADTFDWDGAIASHDKAIELRPQWAKGLGGGASRDARIAYFLGYNELHRQMRLKAHLGFYDSEGLKKAIAEFGKAIERAPDRIGCAYHFRAVASFGLSPASPAPSDLRKVAELGCPAGWNSE